MICSPQPPSPYKSLPSFAGNFPYVLLRAHSLLEVLPCPQLETDLILLLYSYAVDPNLMCYYLIIYLLPFKGPKKWVYKEVYQYFIR